MTDIADLITRLEREWQCPRCGKWCPDSTWSHTVRKSDGTGRLSHYRNLGGPTREVIAALRARQSSIEPL